MFKRHGGKKAEAAAASSDGKNSGGGDPATIARYKNQAAKAREKIVDLVKQRDRMETELNEKTAECNMIENERDDLKDTVQELSEKVETLQTTADVAVFKCDEAIQNLDVAIDEKQFAEINRKNAEEDAEVQRRAKVKAEEESNALKDKVTTSKEQKDKAKQELKETDHLLSQATLKIRQLKKDLEIVPKLRKEMKDRLTNAALDLTRTRALGEDRESELNRWVERLTNQIFKLRKDFKRKAELAQATWRTEQDQRLTTMIQNQTKKMESNRHNLLLSLSDPLLHTPKGQPVKKKIRKARENISNLNIQLKKTNGELQRLRNVTNVVENLVASCADGNIQQVRQIVRMHPNNVSSLNGRKQSAIQVAAREGQLEICKILLNAGADAEPMHDMGTPLYLACRQGHHQVVSLLMEAKYHIPQFVPGTKDGRTALSAACAAGKLKCVELLLRRFPQDVNIVDCNHTTPLHLVCSKLEKSLSNAHGRCQIIRLLINRGGAIHCRDNSGNTPILLAAMSGCIHMLNTCVDFGGSVLDRNRGGKSCVDEARIRKDTNMMQRLNELQKNIPRSVVLASRFAGYKVSGQGTDLVEKLEPVHKGGRGGNESGGSGATRSRKNQRNDRNERNERNDRDRNDLGNQFEDETEDSHSPDASELLVMQNSPNASRPSSRF